jgi:hypothetical protein
MPIANKAMKTVANTMREDLKEWTGRKAFMRCCTKALFLGSLEEVD